MDTAVVTACGGILATVVSAGLALRQTREARRLAKLNGELQADLARLNSDLANERVRFEQELGRELNAEDLLTRYREPLAAAAFDLQSRCWNIVKNDFFEKFGREHERFADAQMTTLFRFAQYFGWAEILRREIQFLSFPEEQDTRCVAELLAKVAARVAASDADETLMIWVDEQRAIGERMIVREGDSARCMGYAAFRDAYDDCFARLFARVIDDLDAPAAMPRLREVQHDLCELVGQLDKKRLRYSLQQLGHA